MADLEYTVTNQGIATTKTSRLVSGTIGVYTVKFTFNNVWDGLEKWATFAPIPGTPYKQPLDANGECTIPGEVMGGVYLRIGVFGLADGQAYPTVWANKLQMEEGCFIEVPVSDWPEPSPVIEEILEELENKVDKPENATPGNVTIIGSNNNISDSGISKDNLILAPQLASNNIKTDSVPYIYRQTGGGIGIGNREYDEIVGGSIVHRQMFNNGAVFTNRSGLTTSNTDDDFTLNGTVSSAITARGWFGIDYTSDLSDHVLYVRNCLVSGTISDMNSGWWSPSSTEMATKPNQERILKSTIASTARGTWYSPSGVTFTNAKMQVLVYDLTERFGSAVADRIYAMEQASAGSGIAVLHAMGLNQYRPYTATPSLESVSGLQSHKTVGFNLFDKSNVFNGYITDTTGNFIANNDSRATDYIQVISGATYYVKSDQTSGQWGAWYDANKQFIEGITYYNHEKVAPQNARYVRFTIFRNGTGDIDTFCFNLSDPARNGTYEPYTEYTYPLDSSLTLRGVAVLDDNNNIKFDGDEYAPDGTVKRRYGYIDMGTISFANVNSTGIARSTAITGAKVDGSLIAIGYTVTAYGDGTAWADLNMVISMTNSSSAPYLRIKNSAFVGKTTAEVATMLSGQYLLYELQTSAYTTETAEPYDSLQICDPLGTEEYVTTGIVPVGHTTKYPTNQVAKLDGLPSDFSTLIAPVEVTFKATRAYTTGRLLIVNNILYKATTSIASGATLTVGTNIVATTLDEVIASL